MRRPPVLNKLESFGSLIGHNKPILHIALGSVPKRLEGLALRKNPVRLANTADLAIYLPARVYPELDNTDLLKQLRHRNHVFGHFAQ